MRTRDKKWMARSRRLRAELGCPQDFDEWTSSHLCTGVPLTKREYDCVDVAFWCWRTNNAIRDGRGHPVWFVDTSQGVETGSWGDAPGTQAQSSRWYSFAIDAVLGPQELAQLHGFPTSCFDRLPVSFTEKIKTSLIGECVHIGNMSAVAYAVYLQASAPWWQSQPSEPAASLPSSAAAGPPASADDSPCRHAAGPRMKRQSQTSAPPSKRWRSLRQTPSTATDGTLHSDGSDTVYEFDACAESADSGRALNDTESFWESFGDEVVAADAVVAAEEAEEEEAATENS